MNANDPNYSSLGSSPAAVPALQTVRAQPAAANAALPSSAPAWAEDMHVLELVRSLRSLAADSPERQAKIEGLMRAYASGDLQVDAEATASAIIDDALAAGRFSAKPKSALG